MSTQKYLIQYGQYILSNNRFGVQESDHYSSVIKETQYQPRARVAGATVVNTRDKARSIGIKGTLRPNNGDLNENIEDLDFLFGKDDQIFRIIPEYQDVFLPTTTSAFSAGSDAVNLGTDNRDIQVSPSSITFDIDVSNSGNDYADIEYTASTPVDLSTHTDSGNFEFAIKIPDILNITSVEFRIGNDSSNYYGKTFTDNYQAGGFDYGWNWLSAPWGNADLPTGHTYENPFVEVGTVNDAAIDYMYIRINYVADSTDIPGCAFGGCVWVREKRVRNYPCFLETSVQKPQSGGMQNSLMPWNAGLINYTGYGRSTHEVLLDSRTGITGGFSHNIFYEGTSDLLPRTTVDIISITSLSQLSILNNRNNQIINFLPSVVTSGDSFELGGLDQVFNANSNPIDRTGVIPTYLPGYNKTQVSFLGGNIVTISGFTGSSDDTIPIIDSFGGVASTFTALANGVVNTAWIAAVPSLYDAFIKMVLYTDSAGRPGTAVDETNSFQLTSAAGATITYTALYTGSASITSGTTYWSSVEYVSGASGGAQYRCLIKATSTAAAGYAYRNLGNPTWTTGTTSGFFKRLGFNIVFSEILTSNIEYNHYYYPLYK